MNNGETKYPNFEPDGLGDFSVLERANSVQAKPILWGHAYLKWDVEKQLEYTQALAASLNQAVEIMQEERDYLSEICFHQEAQLKTNAETYIEQGEFMQTQFTKFNEEKQKLHDIVIEMQGEIVALEERLGD